MILAAPFPWFGGKRRVGPLVWSRFGRVQNYVEPFAGSLAVLLARPDPIVGSETVNDKDGFVANFWRALAGDPDGVAAAADWPVNECDQHARHVWLVGQRETLTLKLEGDPEFFDVKIAGWWVWGIGVWIGAGWCSGDGPWQVDDAGQLVHLGTAGRGVHRQLVHLGDAGQGVHRKRVHLGTAGRGVHRQLVHLGDAGQGNEGVVEWMRALAERLRRVRVCCGDWSRVCGPTPTVKQGLTAVLLDPPYGEAERTSDLYATDSGTVAAECRAWALQWGEDERMRIALCGYEGEHDMPGWTAVSWKAHGGYGSQGTGRGRENAAREVIWFSPHCLSAQRPGLFDGMEARA